MPTQPTPPRRLTTIQATADHFGVHPDTIRRRIADGTLTAWHLRGTKAVRIDLNDAEAKLLRLIPSSDGAV